jgi:RNA polymerase-binding transcription factor
MEGMEGVRSRLAAERQRALRRLESLTRDFDAVVAASRDTNADDEHDPEGATIAFERSQVDAFVQQAQHQLDEIDAAYERVAAGTYGRCGACGADIGDDRLEARPTARLCIRCAAAEAR